MLRWSGGFWRVRGLYSTAIASTEGYNEDLGAGEPGAEPLITDALALAVRGK